MLSMTTLGNPNRGYELFKHCPFDTPVFRPKRLACGPLPRGVRAEAKLQKDPEGAWHSGKFGESRLLHLT